MNEDDQVQVKLSEGEHDAPEPWRELANAINATPDQHAKVIEPGMADGTESQLPVVQGHMHNGEIRVNEVELEAGHRYRVEFGGRVVGEIKVTDPVIARKPNRHDRREMSGSQRKYKLPPHPLAGLQRRSR